MLGHPVFLFGLPDTRMNILGIFGMAGKCVSFSLWGKIPSLNFSPRIRMAGQTRSKSKKMSCNILMMIFLVLLWILTKVNFLSCGFWGPKSRSGHLDKKENRLRDPLLLLLTQVPIFLFPVIYFTHYSMTLYLLNKTDNQFSADRKVSNNKNDYQ